MGIDQGRGVGGGNLPDWERNIVLCRYHVPHGG